MDFVIEIIFLIEFSMHGVWTRSHSSFVCTEARSFCMSVCLLRVNYRWCISVCVFAFFGFARDIMAGSIFYRVFHNRCFFFQLARSLLVLRRKAIPKREERDGHIREYKYAVREGFGSLRFTSFLCFALLCFNVCCVRTPEYLQLKCVYVCTHTHIWLPY